MTQKDSLATRRLVVNRLGIFILLLGVVNRFGQILARRFNGRRHQKLSADPPGTSLPYGAAAHGPRSTWKKCTCSKPSPKKRFAKNQQKALGEGAGERPAARPFPIPFEVPHERLN